MGLLRELLGLVFDTDTTPSDSTAVSCPVCEAYPCRCRDEATTYDNDRNSRPSIGAGTFGKGF